jgi:hypothetical protein
MKHLSHILAGLVVLIACNVQSLRAGDAFVLSSGGDSPMENNYSQYLQARAVSEWLNRTYPRESVWTFFGVGNVEGGKPKLSDVYRRVKRDGTMIDTWLPGSLSRNRPAERDEILGALREEILPVVAGGGTLYLFVGDHGSQTPGRNPESIITLWSMQRDSGSEHGWSHGRDQTLGVTELRGLLTGGIGKGKVVFCMTQCHAGGFHYLSIPHEMTPNTKWFTSTRDWATRRPREITLKAAGFTATDEYSLASGCDPSPDPEQWAGYERYIPEKLLGINLFTMQKTGPTLHSFAEAHLAATLVDNTVDKPYSTSEQYLERWANLIETKLMAEKSVTPAVRKALEAYQREVDGLTPRLNDTSFRERQTQYYDFVAKLAGQSGSLRTLVWNGTQKELQEAIRPGRETMAGMGPTPAPGQGRRGTGRGRRGGAGGTRGGAQGERRRLWNETLRPAWSAAVEANRLAILPDTARDFEKHLLKLEEDGRNLFFGGSGAMQEELYWQAGYGQPETLDSRRAEIISKWASERRAKIVAWGKLQDDAALRDAAERLAVTNAPTMSGMNMTSAEKTISRQTAAERTLFYRRVLGAWQFLLAVNERPALNRLKELTDLERTPLPRGK